MKRMVLAISMLVAAPASAGPFGIEMGQSISSVQGKPTGTPNQYEIQVPRPNAEFVSYTAWATPQSGICRVSALGKTYRNDGEGSEIRLAYETLRRFLTEKYGAGRREESIKPDAQWNAQQWWVRSIEEREREHRTRWSPVTGTLPDDILSMSISVQALDAERPWILLSYNFRNFLECSRTQQLDRTGL